MTSCFVRSKNIFIDAAEIPYQRSTFLSEGVFVILKSLGQGDSYEEVLADVKSAIKFHIETFGEEALGDESAILEAFVAETGI